MDNIQTTPKTTKSANRVLSWTEAAWKEHTANGDKLLTDMRDRLVEIRRERRVLDQEETSLERILDGFKSYTNR